MKRADVALKSVNRIASALADAAHHTSGEWRGIKARIAALTDDELRAATEFELMGKRRTEHLKLLDIEQRRRAGDVSARRFKVAVKS